MGKGAGIDREQFTYLLCTRFGPAAHAMSGHQKVVKTALLWPVGCALPTPIASSDSPDLFVILSEVALGNLSRIGQRYAPIM